MHLSLNKPIMSMASISVGEQQKLSSETEFHLLFSETDASHISCKNIEHWLTKLDIKYNWAVLLIDPTCQFLAWTRYFMRRFSCYKFELMGIGNFGIMYYLVTYPVCIQRPYTTQSYIPQGVCRVEIYEAHITFILYHTNTPFEFVL